ncbi:Rv2578c family radical SAM protein [Cellulomonas dongxiuzhuiae]|uniref:Rv2578c family radical SAM protein n=1 Tax=Cellulomonas dongxiuzhuiae TaxID=2819979 RepID=A0ABX8GN85_9CELL|nr:Rv2578c family radical SAM protein [Cellulomonas dongxiuzhuiae]MBO3093377.1 Rv2578c family radical SAM protein [Cellulomonas dongxiuzhuiae]QWC17652.1 Rv2578c family radical SAM protein [Cellulomonas dongxiuzhuiae]
MRWDGQKIDAGEGDALPGLDLRTLPGLVRSVRTPDFAGVTFHEVLSRTALNRVPDASAVPFRWTVNPMRGCLHACTYCFARGTHRYLDLDAGKDFDTQIVVKTNVAEVLRAEVARRSWAREHVALGTNTDPYQRPEGRYTLMPGIIEALAGSGTPLSVLTKGTLLRRDLPLLAAASRDVPVSLAVSIAVLDDELQQQLEPGTPTARARLSLVRAIRDAGLPVQVLVAPVLPWLTDSTDHLDRLLGAVADAGAQRATVMALHLRPGAREWFLAWLTRERPELVAGYGRVFRGGSYVHGEYRAWLDARVRPLLAKHGLDRPQPDAEGVRWARRDGDAHPAAAQLQPALF